MDKIEKIRKYIEERLVYYPTIYTQAGRELIDLRNLLDTLSEEPDKNLEEEMSRFIRTYFTKPHYDKDFIAEVDWESSMRECARHFHELGKNSK